MNHITVLKEETIEQLNLHPGSVVVDCTLGSGGHSVLALERIGTTGTLIAFDADPAAIDHNQSLTEGDATVHLINRNFRELQPALSELNIAAVDAVMADLGWRTEQFASTEGLPRGFSFQVDEPLIMTFGDPKRYSFTARDIVNDWQEEDIANVIYAYGEEPKARRIARKIVEVRTDTPIETARQLAELVTSVIPNRPGRIHPATKTFQALRIAVNDEFDALHELLQAAFEVLKPHGRLAVISFHSLEDRIVKHTFRNLAHDQKALLVHKKPITPSREALLENPRARSAKLRTIEKLPV